MVSSAALATVLSKSIRLSPMVVFQVAESPQPEFW